MSDLSQSLPGLIPGNAQHIGSRGEQQDSFGFSMFDDADHVGHAGILAVVADGMGGLAMGKDASQIAVQTFLETYMAKDPAEKIADTLDRCLHAANRAVRKIAMEAGLEGEVGTTLVAAVIHEGVLYRTAAGDSRIYLYRDGHLRQLTTDYNYGRILDRLVEKGEMKAAEAEAHPSRAALTSYLGTEKLEEYDSATDAQLTLAPGDKILLASDGLFGFLPEGEFAPLLAADPQKAAEELVRATIALQRPYQDNITVAILGYQLPPPPPLPETKLRKDDAADKESPAAAPVSKTTPQAGKWLKIVGLLAILAALGFLGGQYFARQQAPLLEPPATTDEKPDKAAEKRKEKSSEKKQEQQPDKAPGVPPAEPPRQAPSADKP